MNALLKSDIQIDRKMLAELAVHNEQAFNAIVEKAKATM
jgi:large subunit ribosomal protein L20